MSEEEQDVVDVLKKTGTFDITTHIAIDGIEATSLDHFVRNLDAAVNVASKLRSLFHVLNDVEFVIGKWSSSAWTAELLDARHTHISADRMVTLVLGSYKPHPELVRTLLKYVSAIKTRPWPIDVYLDCHKGYDVDPDVLRVFHEAEFHMNTMYGPEGPWIETHARHQPVVLRFYTDTYTWTEEYLRVLWLNNVDEFKYADPDPSNIYWLSDTVYLGALRENAGDMIYSDPVNYLLDAAYHGFTETVTELLEAYPESELPLHMAVRGGKSYELVEMLLDRGADPNERKSTALAVRLFKENKSPVSYNIAKALLTRGGLAQDEELPDELDEVSNTLEMNVRQRMKRHTPHTVRD